MNTKENNYGLYVGMELPAEVITEWSNNGNNYFDDYDRKWRNAAVIIKENRKISDFKYIGSELAFMISGTWGAFVRAEGFKEFLESKQGGNK